MYTTQCYSLGSILTASLPAAAVADTLTVKKRVWCSSSVNPEHKASVHERAQRKLKTTRVAPVSHLPPQHPKCKVLLVWITASDGGSRLKRLKQACETCTRHLSTAGYKKKRKKKVHKWKYCSIIYNHIPFVAGWVGFFFPCVFHSWWHHFNKDSHLIVLVDAVFCIYTYMCIYIYIFFFMSSGVPGRASVAPCGVSFG